MGAGTRRDIEKASRYKLVREKIEQPEKQIESADLTQGLPMSYVVWIILVV